MHVDLLLKYTPVSHTNILSHLASNKVKKSTIKCKYDILQHSILDLDVKSRC